MLLERQAADLRMLTDPTGWEPDAMLIAKEILHQRRRLAELLDTGDEADAGA